MSFQQGDRVIHRPMFDWRVNNPGRSGTFVAGPGVHETVPGNSLVIGDEFAVVQFDDGPPGQAQMVRLDALAPETSSQRATALDDIRERDRLAIPRMGDPDNDPLLRAEMDRRWLLGEIDRVIAQVEEWETLAARPLKNPACDWAATHAAQIRTALRGGE